MNLSWELKNLFRFPFPEILLALFTYMVFLPRGGGYQMNSALEDMSWQRVTQKFARDSSILAGSYSVQAYLPMIILTSIFATLAFAYEIENGLLKVHFSHPTSKVSLFAAKWLSCFLIIFTTLSCTLLLFTFLFYPENDVYLILNSNFLVYILFMAASEAFFVVSLAVAFSIFSKKASISLVGSFATLYTIQLASQTANLTYLPSASFGYQIGFLFSIGQTPDLLNLLAVPLASAFLTIISYVYFARRLEVA
jgi:ABC-type transport system involved in multi-copper enzyme maturation permease subunit